MLIRLTPRVAVRNTVRTIQGALTMTSEGYVYGQGMTSEGYVYGQGMTCRSQTAPCVDYG